MILKYVFSFIAVALVLYGYIPYLNDTRSGKTKPHFYSWLIWTMVTTVAFLLQIAGNAGTGSIVTLITAILCGVVLWLSSKNKNKNITKSDTVCLVLGVIAIVAWVLADKPLVSILLVTLIDWIGFIPTIRKSWNEPFSETLVFYQISIARFIFAILAIQQYTALSVIYPIGMLMITLIIVVTLVMRRRSVSVSGK